METIDAGNLKQGAGGFFARIETARTRVMNTSHNFSQVDGIILPVSPKLFYATTWKQIEIQPGNIPAEQTEVSSESPERQRDDASAKITEEPGVSSAGKIPQEPQGVSAPKTPKEQDNRIFELFPKMYPFEIENIQDCVRLDLKDMGYLPVRYWSLAGNPFLLQGYYSYRHLIYIRDSGGKCAIGVPGIYSRQNSENASKCGFTEFQTLARVQERQGAFGYWLYYIF